MITLLKSKQKLAASRNLGFTKVATTPRRELTVEDNEMRNEENFNLKVRGPINLLIIFLLFFAIIFLARLVFLMQF